MIMVQGRVRKTSKLAGKVNQFRISLLYSSCGNTAEKVENLIKAKIRNTTKLIAMRVINALFSWPIERRLR